MAPSVVQPRLNSYTHLHVYASKQVIAKDTEWRAAIFEADRARKERNKVQQEVSKKKKAKEECDDLIKQIQDVRGTCLYVLHSNQGLGRRCVLRDPPTHLNTHGSTTRR